MPNQDPELTAHARDMRQDPTRAEAVLWWELRGKSLGVRFRRQVPVGPYVADFACFPARLIIEVDGLTHDGKEEYDGERDRWFNARGWQVMRLSDDEVAEDRDGVVMAIILALERRGTRTGLADGLTQ